MSSETHSPSPVEARLRLAQMSNGASMLIEGHFYSKLDANLFQNLDTKEILEIKDLANLLSNAFLP